MLKRKKKGKAKARVSHTRRKVKRVVKRRAPMTKKKSTSESYVEDEPEVETEQDVTEAESEPEQPELTTTEPADGDTYVVGQDCNVRGQAYVKGATIVLTPEELESVQAIGIKIYPAPGA